MKLLTGFGDRAHNARARALNSALSSPRDRLVPLNNVETNEAIPNFPEAAAEIDITGNWVLDSVLGALGYPVLGALEDKRKFLRTLIGVPPHPSASN